MFTQERLKAEAEERERERIERASKLGKLEKKKTKEKVCIWEAEGCAPLFGIDHLNEY